MKIIYSLLLSFCFLMPSFGAASTPAQTSFAQSSTVSTESLLIGPGDEVHIQVFDTPELDETARVTDKGELPLLFGGSVQISAMPPSEAAHAIEKLLVENKILNNPRVLVTVLQFATQTVTVFGQVVNPGAYAITAPRSVLDVLSLAGGLTDLGDRHVTIERRSGGKQETYFVANDSKTAIQDSVLIYPGDRVVVPKTGVIYILGDVGRPGGYPMTNNDSQLTVLQAVALAGGTPHSAVPGRAKLIRRTAAGTYDETRISISDMQKGKQPDLPLQASDVIFVPSSYIRSNLSMGAAGIVASAASALIYAH